MSVDYTLNDLAMRFDDGMSAIQNAADTLERIAEALDALVRVASGGGSGTTKET